MTEYFTYHDKLESYVKTKINDRSFWFDFDNHNSPGDDHCFMHSLLQFLHKMPVANLSKLCLWNVFELMKLETISSIGYYAPFYVDTTRDQVIKERKLYITNKIYNTRSGDVPLVTSKALHTGTVILEKMNNGEHDVHIVQPKECINDCTKLMYVYKFGDH